MNIQGINQVQVNAEIGMTFAAALRSILRQDPNIILIGEIRDSETAQIAVRASITGHLVLSTIHTNNALATVERLLDMEVERYLLSTALSGIISQRLAKMLCPDCRYQRETTKYEKKVFKKYMNMDVAHVWDANPKGCDHCRKGYHGRIAIHEVLEIDDNIRNALNNDKLDKKDLAKMVYSGSTITMLQDALIKCLEGKTSFEEVYRNIEIENEDDDNYENEMATEIKESVPKEEVVVESDDLLDAPTTKNTENDISNVIVPPAFSAADFADEETTTTESTEKTVENQTTEATQQSANPQTSAQPATTQATPTVDTASQTVPVATTTSVPVTTQTVQPPVVPATTTATPSVPVTPAVPASPVAPATATQPVVPTVAVPGAAQQPQVPVAPSVAPQTVQAAPVVPAVATTPVVPTVAALANTQQVQVPVAPVTQSVVPQVAIPNTAATPVTQQVVASQPPVVTAAATPLSTTNISNLPKLDNDSNPIIPKL